MRKGLLTCKNTTRIALRLRPRLPFNRSDQNCANARLDAYRAPLLNLVNLIEGHAIEGVEVGYTHCQMFVYIRRGDQEKKGEGGKRRKSSGLDDEVRTLPKAKGQRPKRNTGKGKNQEGVEVVAVAALRCRFDSVAAPRYLIVGSR